LRVNRTSIGGAVNINGVGGGEEDGAEGERQRGVGGGEDEDDLAGEQMLTKCGLVPSSGGFCCGNNNTTRRGLQTQ